MSQKVTRLKEIFEMDTYEVLISKQMTREHKKGNLHFHLGYSVQIQDPMTELYHKKLAVNF